MLELTLGRLSDGRAITTAGRENPHIFVDGISGAGKSFKLKRLAEDAVCQGAQVIAFDYPSFTSSSGSWKVLYRSLQAMVSVQELFSL